MTRATANTRFLPQANAVQLIRVENGAHITQFLLERVGVVLDHCVFADLSLGEHRPFECFHQFSLNLETWDMHLNQYIENPEVQDKLDLSDIGKWIDRETQGEICMNICLEHACSFEHACERASISVLAILAPKFGKSFNQTTLKTIETLSYLNGIQVYIFADLKFCKPSNWNEVANFIEEVVEYSASTNAYAFLPSVLSPEEKAFYANFNKEPLSTELLPVQNLFLIPPELRCIPDNEKGHFRGLARLAPDNSYLQAYALMRGETADYLHINAGWHSFVLGDIDLAITYLNAATATDDKNLNQKALDVLQIVLIAVQRYQEAQDNLTRFSSLGEAATLAGAWGATLTGNQHESQQMLGEFAEQAKLSPNRICNLYFVNIYALALFKKGHYDQALALELELKDLLQQQKNKVWHLVYINYLNIARLYRYQKNYDAASDYFEKALNVNLGVMDKFTGLFHALLRAQLYEAKQEQELAEANWIQCLLIWKEIPNKISIPWRLFSTLIKQSEHPPFERCKVFEQALFAKISLIKLEELFRFCHFISNKYARTKIAFTYQGMLFKNHARRKNGFHAGQYITSSKRDISWLDSKSEEWAIDVDPILFTPIGPTECLDRCIRLGIDQLLFDGTLYDVEVEAFKHNFYWQLNPSLENLDQLCSSKNEFLSFRRLREDFHLEPFLKPLIQQVSQNDIGITVNHNNWQAGKKLGRRNLIYMQC